MAVSIQAKDPYQALEAFKVPGHLINALKGGNAIVELAPEAIIISMGGHTVKVAVKSGAVSMALSNKLGPASKQSVSYKLIKAVEEITGDPLLFGYCTVVPTESPTPIDEHDAATGHVDDPATQAHVVKATKPIKTASELFDTFTPSPSLDLKTLLKSNPVKLSEASVLYQPVTSSSSGAKYHVVGITAGAEIKVAARYKGTTLSMRAEGEVEKYKHRMEKAGFSLNNLPQGYVSVHMQVAGATLAARTLAAVLAGMEFDMANTMPNLLAILGEGV